ALLHEEPVRVPVQRRVLAEDVQAGRALMLEGLADHRAGPDAVVEGGFGKVGELPALLRGAQPEIPVFETHARHGAVVAAVALPPLAAVGGARVDVVPVEQAAEAERPDPPAAGSGAEELGVPVGDADRGLLGENLARVTEEGGPK